MPSIRRGCLLTMLSVFSLALGACAAGVEDVGTTGFGGPYGDPADDSQGSTGHEEDSEGDTAPPGGGTGPGGGDDSGGGDDGNPLCCQVHPSPGCDSAMTEACVCMNMASCCQTVWTQDCVDWAVSCGDPYCADDPPPDD